MDLKRNEGKRILDSLFLQEYKLGNEKIKIKFKKLNLIVCLLVMILILPSTISSFDFTFNQHANAQYLPPGYVQQPPMMQSQMQQQQQPPYTTQIDPSVPPQETLPLDENTYDDYAFEQGQEPIEDQSLMPQQEQMAPPSYPQQALSQPQTMPQASIETDEITNNPSSSLPASGSATTTPTYLPPSTMDTTPPETMIISSTDGANVSVVGGGNTSSTMMSFTFAGVDNVAISGFECVVGNSFSDTFVVDSPDDTFADGIFSCSNRVTIGNLQPGTHLFQVRSVDSTGNRDLEPATFSWNILALDNTAGNVPDNQLVQGGGNTASTNTTSN